MAEGKLNPREQARLEEKKKNQKARTKYIVIGIVVLLLVAAIIFVNSRAFADGIPALRVGDTSYTIADVNYEYRRAYMQFTQSYSDYLSVFMDTSLPLDEQECMLDPDGGTWDDYFKSQAESSLTQLTALYKEAVAKGYIITEDDQAEIDNTISTYELYAGLYSYTLDGYLAANFGAGNNEKTVRRHLAQEILVDRYLNELYDGYTFTDAEKDVYYTEHAETLNKVNYLSSYTTTSEDENAPQTAQAVLDAMEGGEADDFRAAALAVKDAEAVQSSNSQTSFLSQFDGSVTEDELTYGTVFTHDTDSGSYAIFVLGLDDNDYNTVSVRHILIKAEDTDGDGEYSDEEKQTAYDALTAIQDEWLSGEATEDSFAALAGQYSQDDGSSANGGLYEDIYKGQMVAEFNDFCFDEHQSGDYGIVYGESTQYAGYHLIYFVGADGELYSRTLADSNLRSEAYNTQVEELLSAYTPQRTFAWRYVMSGT